MTSSGKTSFNYASESVGVFSVSVESAGLQKAGSEWEKDRSTVSQPKPITPAAVIILLDEAEIFRVLLSCLK